MNIPKITLNIGTHEVLLRPLTEGGTVSESLKIVSQWHHAEIVHSWTLKKLAQWANEAENDSDYLAAESRFILLATGLPARPFKD